MGPLQYELHVLQVLFSPWKLYHISFNDTFITQGELSDIFQVYFSPWKAWYIACTENGVSKCELFWCVICFIFPLNALSHWLLWYVSSPVVKRWIIRMSFCKKGLSQLLWWYDFSIVCIIRWCIYKNYILWKSLIIMAALTWVLRSLLKWLIRWLFDGNGHVTITALICFLSSVCSEIDFKITFN